MSSPVIHQTHKANEASSVASSRPIVSKKAMPKKTPSEQRTAAAAARVRVHNMKMGVDFGDLAIRGFYPNLNEASRFLDKPTFNWTSDFWAKMSVKKEGKLITALKCVPLMMIALANISIKPIFVIFALIATTILHFIEESDQQTVLNRRLLRVDLGLAEKADSIESLCDRKALLVLNAWRKEGGDIGVIYESEKMKTDEFLREYYPQESVVKTAKSLNLQIEAVFEASFARIVTKCLGDLHKWSDQETFNLDLGNRLDKFNFLNRDKLKDNIRMDIESRIANSKGETKAKWERILLLFNNFQESERDKADEAMAPLELDISHLGPKPATTGTYAQMPSQAADAHLMSLDSPPPSPRAQVQSLLPELSQQARELALEHLRKVAALSHSSPSIQN